MIAVVSGLPRSGTSLAMQMLEAGGLPPLTDPAGSATHRGADASNPRGYYELDAVRRLRSDASFVREAEGHAVKVIAPLLTFLPEGSAYRVVFVLRHLDEVIASQATMLSRMGRPTGDAAVLKAAFERQLQTAKALLEREDRFRVLYLEHADLVGRPEEAAGSLAAFFQTPGYTLDPSAMAQVAEPSLYRARRAGRREEKSA